MNHLRRALRILLGLFFLSPLLIWLSEIDQWTLPVGPWLKPLSISVEQAGLSAAGSVVCGVLMVMGAMSLHSPRRQKFLEFWLLIPNLIPPLFLILAILNLAAWMPLVSPGLPAVLFTHILLNSGLVALALLRLLNVRLAGSLDLALIEGAGRWMIWRQVILPLLRRELLFLFLFVFSVCLTSFSIPLVLGGNRVTGMEILIYETLRISGDWSLTLFYVVIQMLILFLFAVAIPKPELSLSFSISHWRPIGVRWLLPLAFLPSALLLGGWGAGVMRAAHHFVPESIAAVDLAGAALGTLAVGLGVGFSIVLLCLWISFVWPHRALSLFMKGYLAPSATITGFALLLVPGVGDVSSLIKIIVALTLISFPLLFRWMGQAALEGLDEQIVVARSLGASWVQILFELIWPQRAGVFLRMAGVGSLWACGDFAVSSILADGDKTWALWIETLIDSYRLDLASLMTVPLFAMGLLCYGFFVGASRYVRH